MPEQPCALRALSDPDDHDAECVALPCACDAAREQERADRDAPSLSEIARWLRMELIDEERAVELCGALLRR